MVSGKKLSVAIADPTDLRAIDELSFRTGYVIQPMEEKKRKIKPGNWRLG